MGVQSQILPRRTDHQIRKARWVVGDDKQIAASTEEVISSVGKAMAYEAAIKSSKWTFDAAFPNNALEEEIYVEQPHGFNDGLDASASLNKHSTVESKDLEPGIKH